MAPTKQSPQKKSSPLRKRVLSLIGAGTLVTAFGPVADQSYASEAHAAAIISAAQPATDNAAIPSRTLSFHNLHTEERVTETYWRNGEYDLAAIQRIEHLLRDRRNGESHAVNPQTLDFVYDITQELQERFPAYRRNPMVIEVISGYRSTETLVAQRREGRNVAQGTSQHELGNAIDFRISGIPINRLRDTAWCMERGGVGTYRGDGFVHVDTGRHRFWPAGERGRCPVR